jgi:hypothetical protein
VRTGENATYLSITDTQCLLFCVSAIESVR